MKVIIYICQYLDQLNVNVMAETDLNHDNKNKILLNIKYYF